MTTTIDGVSIKHGETHTYRHFGHKTLVTPVMLAVPYENFREGKIIGKIQTRHIFGMRRQESATFSRDAAVLGHDYDWLVREFKDNECGGRQARLNRIQPAREYCATRTFGYLAHNPCIYERGDLILVKAADTDTITTEVSRTARPTQTLQWTRESFEALINTFAIVEQKHETAK
jgi:hypothetical protein